jgi:hypothetical protein
MCGPLLWQADVLLGSKHSGGCDTYYTVQDQHQFRLSLSCGRHSRPLLGRCLTRIGYVCRGIYLFRFHASTCATAVAPQEFRTWHSSRPLPHCSDPVCYRRHGRHGLRSFVFSVRLLSDHQKVSAIAVRSVRGDTNSRASPCRELPETKSFEKVRVDAQGL